MIIKVNGELAEYCFAVGNEVFDVEDDLKHWMDKVKARKDNSVSTGMWTAALKNIE
jgi:hypothetical protein